MIDSKQIERAARVYRTNGLAAAALGINKGTFAKLCKEMGILAPLQRRPKGKSNWVEARRKFRGLRDRSGLSE